MNNVKIEVFVMHNTRRKNKENARYKKKKE